MWFILVKYPHLQHFMRKFWLYLPAKQDDFCTCLPTCGHVAALSAPLAATKAAATAATNIKAAAKTAT